MINFDAYIVVCKCSTTYLSTSIVEHCTTDLIETAKGLIRWRRRLLWRRMLIKLTSVLILTL